MGGKSSTTTTENKPPAWAEPLFKQSATEAQKLYNQDKGFNVYQGDRVVDMNTQQLDAIKTLGGMDELAKTTVYNADDYGRMANQAGSNSYSESGLGRLREGMMLDAASGMDYNADEYGALANQAGGQTFAEQNLRNIAAGKSLMGDPLFQEMLDAQSAKIADQANFAASAAGRYGSGMHTGVLAQNVGDFRRDAVLQNYAAERERQLAANQMLDSSRFQRMGMQGDFLGQQAGANQSKFANQMAAQQQRMDVASQMDQARMARMGMEADLYGRQSAEAQRRFDNIGTGGQAALQAGTFYQGQKQAELDAQMAAWKERDMEDWTRLGALQAAASGAAGPYGMSTMSQNQPFNPLGLLGTLGSLFMSDRRMKQDVRKVGDDPRGFGIYEFAYRAQPGIRWRGVMADEVEKVAPSAVADMGAYKAVNYAALGLTMERV